MPACDWPIPFLSHPPSSGALGDWYVHLIRFGRDQFVLATSERSLLTVMRPARDVRAKLAPHLREALGGLLETLGIPREAIRREIAGMEPVSFGRATSRRILGSMNDFAFQASIHRAHDDAELLAISHRLAGTPMSAIGRRPGHVGFPNQLARELLNAQWA